MLGFSVYFQDYNEDYIKACAKIGAKYVFTSLHIPEEDYSHLDEQLPALIDLCQSLDLIICPDVSPVTFEKLHLKHGDFETLKQMGFKALRLDYGFDTIEHIQQLIQDFDLFLNASTLDETFIQKLIDHKIDLKHIRFTYNFYPKRYTGLSEKTFMEKQEIMNRYHLNSQAFICGDVLKRFPMYEGLPTLEKHRDMPPLQATMELLSMGVTDVMVGDSQIDLELLHTIYRYVTNNELELRVRLDQPYEHLYNQVLTLRLDQSDELLRINQPRQAHIKPYKNGYRNLGAITIDNELMGRYSGELSIVRQPIHSDARVNVIGFVHPDDVLLLPLICSDIKIIFKKL